jgi:hypothetical protein
MDRIGHPASCHEVEDLCVCIAPSSLDQLKLVSALYGAHPCTRRSNGMQLLAAFMVHTFARVDLMSLRAPP